jgi:release factor glutamine methyltransferase
VGVDVSRQALSYAAANARRLGFDTRSSLSLGDWAEGISERFDLVLCNPPYVAEGAELGPGVVEYEPDEALFAGEEGLGAYRALAPQLPQLLNPGGLAAVEIGPSQADAVVDLLARDGLSARLAQDLGSRDRVVLLTWA